MAPTSTIHLVRHAQGYHQLPRDHPDVQIRDASLTDNGILEAKGFCERFPYHHQTDLLCASPMTRAIQTTQYAFAPELERGMVILAIPEAQEAQDDPSSTGSPLDQLQHKFASNVVDLHLLTEDWYRKDGVNAYEDKALHERARKLRTILKERPEEHIVLVTHGLFAHYITEHIDPEGHQTGEYWTNVMWRTFNFSNEGAERAHLVETEESISRHPQRSATAASS